MAISSRQKRYAGHTKIGRYCSCGRVVYGNGGRRHFELEGHKRVIYDVWRRTRDEADA